MLYNAKPKSYIDLEKLKTVNTILPISKKQAYYGYRKLLLNINRCKSMNDCMRLVNLVYIVGKHLNVFDKKNMNTLVSSFFNKMEQYYKPPTFE